MLTGEGTRLWRGNERRGVCVGSEPMAEPAFTAHLEGVVPYWVATLAAGVCRAYGMAPTMALMDSVVGESYETAWRLFLADEAGRTEDSSAKRAVDGSKERKQA